MKRRVVAALLVMTMVFGPEMSLASPMGSISVFAEETSSESDGEAPVVVEEPAPQEESAPAPQEESEPAPKEESAPAPKEEPAPAPKEEPAPAPKEEPAPAPKEEPAPAPKEEPAPAPQEEPAPAPQEEAAPAPQEEAAPAPQEEPAPAAEEPAPAAEEISAPASEETPSHEEVSVSSSGDTLSSEETHVSEETSASVSEEAPSSKEASASVSEEAPSSKETSASVSEEAPSSEEVSASVSEEMTASGEESSQGEGKETVSSNENDQQESAQETGEQSEAVDPVSSIPADKIMLAASPKAVGSTALPLSYSAANAGSALSDAADSDSSAGSEDTSYADNDVALAGSVDGEDDTALAGAPGSGSGSESASLQEMIDSVLDAVAGALKGKLLITLKRNTIYTGDVTITSQGRNVEDDFELELAAEDAGQGGLEADGSILYTGNMLIRNLAVTIKGMGIQGAVSVQDAKLNYYGTAGDDDVNISASGADAMASIQTGDGADNVNVEAIDEAALILHTGEGSDKVRALVTGGGKAEIKTGEDDDTVILRQGAGDVSVYTNEGDDTVAVTDLGGEGSLRVRTQEGYDSVSVKGREEGASASDPGTKEQIDVDLGEGMDEAVVDLSAATAAEKVVIKGGADSDRLHITGELDANVPEEERASGTEENMVLRGTSGTLGLTTSDVENFTDDLKNKRTIWVNPEDLTVDPDHEGALVYDKVSEAFTNYVYNDSISSIDELTVKKAAEGKLPLTSFVIDARTAGENNKLVLKPSATLKAEGLQLALRGREVEVGSNSTIAAGSLRIEAYSSTTSNAPTVKIAGTAIPADLLNISDKAHVVIREGAKLFSEGDVLIQAKVEQDSGLITLAPEMNLLELKLAKAIVDMDGEIYADGNVSIITAVDTNAGIAKDGTAYSGLPFAVTVASADSAVNIGNAGNSQKAVITAGDSIRLNARSNMEVSSRADSTNGLPVAIAATVLTGDTTVNTANSELSSGKDVILSASGDVEAATIAEKGEGQKGATGGYLSAAVVLQNVNAGLNTEKGKNSVVEAGGDVIVKTTSRQKVDTKAESGTITEESGDTSEDADLHQAYDDLMGLWDAVKGMFGGDDDQQEKLDDAAKKIAVSDHSVRVDEAAQEDGDVQIDTASDKDNVTINVTPRPGRKVKSITWRGLDPGETTYTTGTFTDTNSCSFPQTKKNVTVDTTIKSRHTANAIMKQSGIDYHF